MVVDRASLVVNPNQARRRAPQRGPGMAPAACCRMATGGTSMSSSLWRRAALAAVLGCGVWSGLARAEELYPKVHPAAQELPPGVPAVDNTPSHRPIRDWLHLRRPLCCWASFNGYGCSSLKSECAFMFGSCRTFYAEP